MKTRAHLMISGTVQGVFFRASVRDRARDLGVSGWVRNTGDGKVEAVFEGEKPRVMELIDFCREGPPQANVEDISVETLNYEAEFSGFNIRH